MPNQRLGPTRLDDQSFDRRYNILYRVLKLPKVSAALARFYMRPGISLPQVDHRIWVRAEKTGIFQVLEDEPEPRVGLGQQRTPLRGARLPGLSQAAPGFDTRKAQPTPTSTRPTAKL